MIVIDMDLISARTLQRTSLCKLQIVNDGTGTSTHGNYHWTIKGKRGQIIKQGILKDWPRLAKTPAALLQKVLNTAYPTAR
jgi:hypothetical protein